MRFGSLRWGQNILLMLLSVCLTFGVAELLLRLSHRIPTNSLRSPDLETLERQPGLFQPNQDFIDRLNPALPYHIRTNSLGFRGPEVSRQKTPGRVRVLCVGDSYTFGPGVDDDGALPGVLSRLLGSLPPPGAEVINGGVSGFTITDERRFLEERAMSLQPDVVLLFFSQNDIRDLGQPRSTFDLMRDNAALKSKPVLGVAIRLLQRSALFNAMQKLAAELRVRRRAARAPALNRSMEKYWLQYAEELRALDALIRTRGAKWALVAWPSADQILKAGSTEPQARLEKLAVEVGVPYLDLTPVVRDLQAGGTKAFLLPVDGHPTGDSYETAAASVRSFLGTLGYLPPDGRNAGVQR